MDSSESASGRAVLASSTPRIQGVAPLVGSGGAVLVILDDATQPAAFMTRQRGERNGISTKKLTVAQPLHEPQRRCPWHTRRRPSRRLTAMLQRLGSCAGRANL